MTETPGQALVAPSDIADTLGISRGAVSNWRKRAADFPEPVAGNPVKPLFDRAAVEKWLLDNKKVTDPYSLQVGADMQIWSLLNTLRGALPAEEIPNLLLTLACAKKLSDASDLDLAPWQAIAAAVETEGLDALGRGADFGIANWNDLVHVTRGMRALDPFFAAKLIDGFSSIPADKLAAATDRVLARSASANIRAGLENGFIGSRISTLLANAAGNDAAGVLYDPACGIGDAIIQVATRDTTNITRIVGQDLMPAALRAFEQRALLADIVADAVAGDVLVKDPDPSLKADVIICEPPVGIRWEVPVADPRWMFGAPPPVSAHFAWLQHAIAHLADDGTAYVTSINSALFNAGFSASIRANLLRAGCVQAVVALPPKMLPHTAVPLALWVLRRPSIDRRTVRVIDASAMEAPEEHIGDLIHGHLDVEGDVPHADVAVEDLLVEGANLNPSRWIVGDGADPTEVAHAYAARLQAVNSNLEHLAGLDLPVPAFTEGRGARVVTVGDLVRSGAVELRHGRVGRSDMERDDVIVARDVSNGVLPEHEAPDATDPELTQPGDVLVTTTHKISTLMEPIGHHRVAVGVTRLRCLTDEFSPVYLHYILRGHWNGRHLVGATVQRANVRDLEVPVVSREQQDAFVAAAEQIENIRLAAVALEDHARELNAHMIEAVRYDVDLTSLERK